MTDVVIQTVAGARDAEAPATLLEPVPQSLGFADMLSLWSNLGISLLGFTGAIFVLQPDGGGTPRLSVLAAVVATVVGTLLGTLAIAAAAVPGVLTGAPSMVLLRGLFGARLSYLPTALNVLQCLGWGIFELVTIATAAHTVLPGLPRAAAVVLAGAVTCALTLRPLGAVRVLRRWVLAAVVIVMAYLFVELAAHPLPSLTRGTWSGFWVAVDTAVAVAVSFVPLAADYTRHASSPRKAFWGTLLGYGTAQVACYLLGLLALITVARTPDDIFGAFIAVPAGSVAFAVLAARELDQSFANVYSTAVSMQNIRRSWDRRVLAVALGIVTTVCALSLDIADYESFLSLLGSVFVPMFGVLIVDFFVVTRHRWDLADSSPARWSRLVPWALGFVTYQLIDPGGVSWWVSLWASIAHGLRFAPASWMSASLLSFGVSAVATALLGVVQRLTPSAPRR